MVQEYSLLVAIASGATEIQENHFSKDLQVIWLKKNALWKSLIKLRENDKKKGVYHE